MEERSSITTTTTVSLSTIGIITGIVLCILQATGAINIGWFWATFPFWVIPATTITFIMVLFIIAVTVCGINNLIIKIKDSKERKEE